MAFADTGAPPATSDDERQALQALAAAHVVALDEHGEIDMAHPFAAHRRGVSVTAGERTWWGSCAWDAYGIAAALRLDAYELGESGELFHVAVSAAHWWDDIAFT